MPSEMRHVEVGAVVAASLQLAVDAARDHVARGKLLARVVALHERVAGAIAQDPAFPRKASLIRKLFACGW